MSAAANADRALGDRLFCGKHWNAASTVLFEHDRFWPIAAF